METINAVLFVEGAPAISLSAERGKTALQETVYFVKATGEGSAGLERTQTKWDFKPTTEIVR
jgi:hypothetical protein